MAAAMTNHVDGEWQESTGGDTFEVRNPADPGDVVGEFQRSSEDDAAAAVEAAAAVQTDRAAIPGPAGGGVLTEAARPKADRLHRRRVRATSRNRLPRAR